MNACKSLSTRLDTLVFDTHEDLSDVANLASYLVVDWDHN
jgi:hypothetical protein